MQIPGKSFFRFLSVKHLSLSLVLMMMAGTSLAQSVGLTFSRVYGNYSSSAPGNHAETNYFELRGGKAYDFSLTGSYSFEPRDREHTYKWVAGLELNRTFLHYSIIQSGYNSANHFDLKPKPASIRTEIYQVGTSLTPSFGIKLNADKQWSLLLGAGISYRLKANNFSDTYFDNRNPEIYTELNVFGSSNLSLTPQVFALFEYHASKRHSVLIGMEAALRGRRVQHVQLVQHVYEEKYFYEVFTSMYSMATFNIGYSFNFLRNEE